MLRLLVPFLKEVDEGKYHFEELNYFLFCLFCRYCSTDMLVDFVKELSGLFEVFVEFHSKIWNVCLIKLNHIFPTYSFYSSYPIKGAITLRFLASGDTHSYQSLHYLLKYSN